jgi:hypothetical protein
MKVTVYFALVMFVAGAGLAVAQNAMPVGPANAIAPAYPSSYYSYPYGFSFSSTPFEGYSRGMADVIRSRGDFNLSSSAAAVNLSEARQREIENQKLWTKTYFEIRDINREAFDAEQRRLRASPEDWIRYAQSGRPQRLSPSELDTVTGEIHWPMLLTMPQFKAQRVEMEKAFADRAYHGVMGAEVFLRVLQVADDLLANLQSQIRNVPADKYLLAKRFLQSMVYEASQPAG